jgi:hypothetical protein
MEKGSAMIFDAVVEYFEKDNWKYAQLPNQTILRMGFGGKNGNWTCYAQTREEEQQFIFYSVLPSNAPEEKRHNIAEFTTRANYNLVVGNFEMDYSDGEIRYKTSMNLTNIEPTHAVIHGLVVPNIYTTDRFFPGIMAVLYAGVSPEDAVAQVRNSS